MGKYSSALFGTEDFTPWTPPALDLTLFQYVRRPELKKVNEQGQVYAADTMINTTSHAYGYSSMTAYDNATQYYINNTKDRPSAWLALPANYGNQQYTEEKNGYETNAWAVEKFNKNPCFYYFLFTKSKGADLPVRYDNTGIDGKYISAYYKTTTYEYTEVPFLSEPSISRKILGATERVWTTTHEYNYSPLYGIDDWIKRIITINGDSSDGRKYESFDKSINGYTNPLILSGLQTVLIAWKALENSVYNDIKVEYERIELDKPENYNMIGSNIITDFPVFTVEHVNEMIKYFQGESWISDNNPPPSDWSTDWDIYVKGTQKPDIFITMKSDKVDAWLKDTEKNTGGVEKQDILVEYRYRKYEKITESGGIILPVPTWNRSKYLLAPYKKDKYDDTRETDYMSNCELNFDGFISTYSSAIDSDASIDWAYTYYAEMEFRLKYGSYSSAWCRYEIGVIGSPSIPDFSTMNNVGEVVVDQEVIDKSTVTLHYDEYPDGYNPYPTPPNPDMPPLRPTDPHPSENGMGLLTQTYKITPANAKALGEFFWGGDLFQKIKSLNTSPIENVVGLTIMPINIDGTSAVITIGDVDTNINGDVINNIPIYSLGSIEIKGRYGNFLDFEPYTSMFLFLPFVGFVRIDPAYVTGKTLSVKYSFDLICGMCNAMIFVNDIYVESHQGHCGINIPLIATNRADLQIGLATSLLATAATAALVPEALPAAIGAGMSLTKASASYISSFHSDRQSGYNPTCAWTETRECYLIVESPNASYSATFAHDVGKPCLASMNIGSLSGFTQVESADLSGFSGATEEEKEMLMNILQTGFYA